MKTRLNFPTSFSPRWIAGSWAGGCDVSLESSNPGVIAPDGRVTRPTMEQGNQTVSITATISKDGVFDTKEFK